MITWTEINPHNLPQGEVLCCNKQNDCIIGYVTIDSKNSVQAESEHELLLNVTHYSLINKP